MPRPTTRPKARNGSGSIRPDRDGYRVWSPRRPDGKRPNKRVATWDEAERVLAQFKIDADNGVPGDGESWTVGAWFDHWITTPAMTGRTGRHKKGLAPETVRQERFVSDAIRSGLGTIPLAKLSRLDVERFLVDRANGIGVDRQAWSAMTAGHVKRFLARGLDEAIARKIMGGPNPARFDHAPGRRREERHALSDLDRLRLCVAARRRDTSAGACVAFLAVMGMRQREARDMRWRDVDLKANTLTIPKSKTPTGVRTVRIPPDGLAILRDLVRPIDRDAHVFPGRFAGRGVSQDSVIREVISLCVELGITVPGVDGPRSIHPHELRHTVATVLLQKGVPPIEVAGFLGDTVRAFLESYAHIVDGVRGDGVVAAFGAVAS